MGEEQRHGIGARGPGVDEVDPEPVDLDTELGEAVQPRLGRSPVVALGPVVAELAQVGVWDALGPVGDRLGLGPPGAPEPFGQVAQLDLGDSIRNGVTVLPLITVDGNDGRVYRSRTTLVVDAVPTGGGLDPRAGRPRVSSRVPVRS